MKLGIISDIHADLPNLEFAVDLLNTHHVDKIICAGDLVRRGAYGDEVIQFVLSHDIDCVRGNHDDIAIEKGALKAETLDFLRQLPLIRQYTFDGNRILLAHGTPTSDTIYLFPESMSVRFREIAHSENADVFIFGHTHTPMHVRYRLRNKHFFNAGSIYQDESRGGSQTCATLELPQFDFQVYGLSNGKSQPVTTIKI